VASDHFAGDIMKLQELADLVGISRRQYYAITLFLQFINDRQKKRNMRRIIQIYPDFFS
jgi:hypothetical protein